ncbi:chloride channel protein [Collinsella stercoris]|uniref:Chloride transporter, ClC family n=1 Tax=Collinsella stercoris DSM 13279 TaxID=445975 RepID=B6GCV3_9ACTN|nr:chloride channel protein [Collinsella stercoris]EEA89865.1 chloride transporter, ClC family [Collinsella stercoris DSM 13279]UEA45884.1 chloride channel protein [Collinsella stercoris DSM 13279]UWP11596.1 chloride channel protein [Collinsella stercoris]
MPKQVIESAREGLRRESRELAIDARRDMGNARASLRVFALSVVIAALMGAAGWAFLAALRLATGVREAHLWLFLLLPAVNMATAWLYRNHGLRAQRGNNLVIDSTITGTPIHKRMALLTFACSTATHLAGGSAGREGAAVQMGGTIASNVASLFHVEGHDRRDLMMAGISAAFGAAFGTPLAGAFFGMEMCFIGKLDYSAALYCLTGSFVGNAVSRALGSPFAFEQIAAVPAMSPLTLAVVLAAAVAFGLTAQLFTFCIRTVKRLYARFFTNYLVAAAMGGLLLAVLFLGCGLHAYGGLSEWLVPAAFTGKTTLADPLAKLGMTALTVGAGLQGGEVTPLFGIGASLGGWIGATMLGDPSFMAALGMLGVFGAALNVPVTTIMLGIDMFGASASAYFVIVTFVSYLVAGHQAVYPAQRIVTPKRRSLKGDAELSVEHALEQRRAEIAKMVDANEEDC